MSRRWNWMSEHFNQILTPLPILHIGFYTALFLDLDPEAEGPVHVRGNAPL
jgi:hypothetical protein